MLSYRKAVPFAAFLLLIPIIGAAKVQNRKLHPLPNPAVPASLGVNIHFTSPRPGEMDRIAAAGFRWVRMDFTWDSIERVKGRYDFSAYDGLEAQLRKRGMRAIFILDYGNDLYENGPPRTRAARAAFARFAAAAVRHFRNQGVLWEMWNEPNGGFWKPKANVAEYSALALEVGKAIRATAPDEWYIGPATSTVDLPFLEKCFQAGLLQYWDAVSVHPYRQTPPETSSDDLANLRRLVDRYAPRGKRIPLISGEWGYSELFSGLGVTQQGKYLPREFLSNLANGLVVSIWYDWHDDGTDPRNSEHHFGTVFNDFRPKPAYRAAQTLFHSLDGFRFNKRLALPDPNDWCLVFSRGDQVRLAVWTTAHGTHPAIVPASPGRFRATGYTGQTRVLDAGSAGLRVELTDAPVYLAPEGRNSLLSVAAAWRGLPPELAMTGSGGLASLLPELISPGGSARRPERTKGLRIVDLGTGAGATFNGTEDEAERSRRLSILISPYDRSERPHRIRAVLTVNGLGIAQETAIRSRAPIRASVLPVGPEAVAVRLDDLSDVPLDGIVLLAGSPSSQAPVHLKPNERNRVIRLPASADATGPHDVRILVEERLPEGKFVHILPPLSVRLAPLESFSRYTVGSTLPRADYTLVPDGDPNVASRIEGSIVAPPPGLPFAASKSARIRYQFDPGWKFLRLAPQGDLRNPLPGKPRSLGIWVDGDGGGNLVRMRFTDATGQTFQPDGGPIDWKGWRYVAFSLRGDNAGHWSGANDGVVHYPIHIDTLLLIDSRDRSGTSGVVTLTGATLVYEPRD